MAFVLGVHSRMIVGWQVARYTDRLADIGAAASVGSLGDSYDCEDGLIAAGVA